MGLVLASISFAIIYNMPPKPPLINGILIPNPVAIKPFTVLDQNNEPFKNENLLGKWHMVSYGYTSCPDVCPTVLNVLTKLEANLNYKQEYTNLDIIFYSIDHQRDTAAQLAEYLSYFSQGFIGLTYVDDMKKLALPFETSLGMISILTPIQSSESDNLSLKNNLPENKTSSAYTVSHGFMLYLINPEGKLQAVFKPELDKDGYYYYREEQLLEDYLAIRNFLG